MEFDIGNGYTLRPWEDAWRDGDRERMVALADEHDVWAQLRDRFPHPYTPEDAEGWVALQSGQHPPTQFAVCDEAGPIGAIGLETREADYRHSAELGYWLGKPFWGRGIMTGAVRLLVVYGFEGLGLLRIDAHVKSGNPASARVLEKAGFRREGVLRKAALKEGELVDHILFGILYEDYEAILRASGFTPAYPAPPIPL